MGDDEPAIQWSNLSLEDKQVFFSWLDEFFSRYLNISPRSTIGTIEPASPPSASHGPPVRSLLL